MNTIKERLHLLRQLMQKHNIDALIIPGTDPHSSEYVNPHWQERTWISGFNGSAGTIVVTLTEAGLWTDSRYFLQATEQLADTSIQLYKEGIIGTPSIEEYLIATLPEEGVVAINAEMFTINAVQNLYDTLSQNGIRLSTEYDLIGQLWTMDRPEIPLNPIFILDEKFTGKSAQSKINKLRETLVANKCTHAVYSGLDEIAWLFNIRGTDVKYNPVAIAYAVVGLNEAILFIDSRKVPATVATHLQSQGIALAPYTTINDYLLQLPNTATLAIDYSKINYALYQNATCSKKNIPSAIMTTKCRKNTTELAGIRHAMEKDGVALVRFFKWFEDAIKHTPLTEISVVDKLHEFRAQGENFTDESFGTIAAYAEHGAIVHYEATNESNIPLKRNNFFLLDSGGQYYDGTTDITRTIALGEISEEQQRDYTLVLKGHIALAQAQFPYGTRGVQLDILARQFLWQNALNYGHGTGHGVGHYLCCHEGPQNIRTDLNPTILEEGMVMSNEPGVYKANKWGIRIENLVTVIEKENNEFGKFLAFETLTLCPIDTTPIVLPLMTKEELEWLNSYHKMVYERLSPHLSTEENKWLAAKTKPLQTY